VDRCGTTAGRSPPCPGEGLVAEIDDAELFLYPGSSHLFADSSLDDYDEQAAGLLKERTLAFLHRVG
jgi:dienelactone hydrolase